VKVNHRDGTVKRWDTDGWREPHPSIKREHASCRRAAERQVISRILRDVVDPDDVMFPLDLEITDPWCYD
jgi:hypothetical protein